MHLFNISKLILTNKPTLKVSCPNCSVKFFWTRPEKRYFEEGGTLRVRCRNCSQLYWIVKTRDNSGFYTKVNR